MFTAVVLPTVEDSDTFVYAGTLGLSACIAHSTGRTITASSSGTAQTPISRGDTVFRGLVFIWWSQFRLFRGLLGPAYSAMGKIGWTLDSELMVASKRSN